VSTFEGGLGDLSLDRRHLLPNQAYISINSDIKTEIGALRAVRDNLQFSVLPASINSVNDYLNKLLVHAGENLYYDNLTTAKRSFASTSPMQVIKFEGNAYLTNGVEFLKFDGSTFVTPFIDAPSSSSIVLAEGGAANLEAGIYSYVFTWRPKDLAFLSAYDQEESPPSAAIEITITADKEIDLSVLPTSTLYNLVIYRQKLGEGSEYREVTQMSSDGTTYTDNLLFHQLGEDILKTALYVTPPIPRHITLHNRNLFMTGITFWPNSNISQTILDNYLLVSDDGRMSGWPKFALDIIGQTGDKIMNHLPLTENALLIYTRKKIRKITGYSLLTYRQESTFSPIGLGAEWALTDTVQFGHLFLGSNRKINIFDGNSIIGDARNQFKRIDPIFAKFSEYPHRINWDEREKARMSYFDGIGYLAYPSHDSTVNNRVLQMNMRSPREIIFTISDWETTWLFPDFGNSIFYMGDSDGNLKKVESDPDNYRAVTHQGKDEDGGDIIKDKNFKELHVDYSSPNTNVTAKLYVDDTLNNTIEFDKSVNKKTRGIVDSQSKSFVSPNKGKRTSIEFSWPATTEKVVVYETSIEINKAQRP
jgi:hypothetical protein